MARVIFDPRAEGVRKWGCSKCKGETFADQDHQQESRNCNGDSPRRLYLEAIPESKVCPWSEITTEAIFWMNTFQDWESWRVPPFGGSDITEHPAYVLEAYQLIRNLKIEIENDTAKREADKAKKEAAQWQRKQR